MIVVIDCNIWVSLALNQQTSFISSLQENDITIAACKEFFDELLDVITRPKFEKYFSKTYIDKFIEVYNLSTVTFTVKQIDNIVSDTKDNYLFALSKIANAEHLITGDKLLLQVGQYEHTSVTTLAEFKKIVDTNF